MILKKIRLNNIRSYVNGEITFPEGNLLLAGNIGSGKSTILLAIDFVLFGLRKSSLSGGSLLRAGVNEGCVELFFNIDNKDIIIKRVLRRGTTITQSSGYIIINGEKKDLSAMELKQAVLDLLNYPQELLTKSKSMIFHYTVYTPQEEMKKILLGDKELRLDTLRKVFGIDKYKVVKENAKIFLTGLREKTNVLKGKIERLEEKKQEKLEKENKKKEIEIRINEIKQIFEKKNNEVNERRKKIKEIEKQIIEINELKKQFSIIEVNIKNKLERISNSNSEIEDIDNKLKNIKIEDIKEGGIKEKIDEIRNKIDDAEKSLRLISNKINVATINQENSRKIVNSIQRLDTCPTCKQKVEEEYKKRVIGEENKEMIRYREEIKNGKEEKEFVENSLKRLKKEFELLQEREKVIGINELKKREVSVYDLRKRVIGEELKKLKNEVELLEKNKLDLTNKIEEYKELDLEKDKEELETLEKELRDIELELNSQEVEFKNSLDLIASLEKEIEDMTKIKEIFVYLNEIKNWINDHFINMIDLIEKNVMFRVHSDFNSLFQKWFDILVDNENLKINLDKDFSPLITQGGHDLDYLYLSGGEKNAAALAYRLALNQVINNLITDIKTKDLLILDEPTDGFSDEQLDRMRIVLEELNIKQIILVSHEIKIESFVDNVIKFKKENNISGVLY